MMIQNEIEAHADQYLFNQAPKALLIAIYCEMKAKYVRTSADLRCKSGRVHQAEFRSGICVMRNNGSVQLWCTLENMIEIYHNNNYHR